MELWKNQTISLLLIICLGAAGFIKIQSDADKLCHFARASWKQRHGLVIALTTPSKLADNLDKSDPKVQVLQAQIEHANAIKETNRTNLLAEGGPQTTC